MHNVLHPGSFMLRIQDDDIFLQKYRDELSSKVRHPEPLAVKDTGVKATARIIYLFVSEN